MQQSHDAPFVSIVKRTENTEYKVLISEDFVCTVYAGRTDRVRLAGLPGNYAGPAGDIGRALAGRVAEIQRALRSAQARKALVFGLRAALGAAYTVSLRCSPKH